MTSKQIKCVFGNCKLVFQCPKKCLGICQHNRLNVFRDECFDCGAILVGNEWKYGRSKEEAVVV